MARSPRALLIGAGACGAAFALLLLVAYGSARARWLDATAMGGFVDLQRPYVGGLSERLASLGDPGSVGLIGAALAGLALARGKPRHALAVIALIALTSVSSQLLQALLAYPRWESVLVGGDVDPAAFPSGHATAAMTLALAGVLVAPARARPLAAAAGVGLAVAASYSIVSLGWHYPSDVGGGFLLATGWALVVAAGLREAARRWPERALRSRARVATARLVDRASELGLVAGLAGALVAGGLLAATLVAFRLSEILEYAQAHTAFAVVASALAASAMLLLAGVTGALRRDA